MLVHNNKEKKVTLKKAITIIKLSLFVIWFWPLSPKTSKHKILYMKLYQYVCMLLTVTVLASMIYALLNNLNNLEFMVKTLVGVFPCSHVIGNILFHQVNYQRLQYVTLEMENFCALIKPHEKTIIQRKYVDKYSNFYGLCIILFYMSLFVLFMGPIVLSDQPLPVYAEFPFDTSYQPLRAITYMHQIVVGLFIAAHLCVNVFMAFLLWFTSARFELLAEELHTITNIYDFMKFIEKHQQLLKYAREIVVVVRPYASITICFSTIASVIFGLIFIAKVPLSLKIQCILLINSALLEVYMYTWPAEHLIHLSTNIAQTVFEMNWYKESEYFRKNLQIIIMRSQKPILVILPCGLPSLSLHYYTSYLSTIFSYFTTVRIMLEKEVS